MRNFLDRLLRRTPSSPPPRRRTPVAPAPADGNLRQLIDTSPLPVALVSNEGRIEYLNRKFLETFGYTHEELPTLDAWWPRAYPDATTRNAMQLAWCQRMMAVAAEGGEFQPHETRVTCRDGSHRTIEWHATHFGQMTLVLGTDLTERLNASLALAASEERYRVLIEHAPEAVVLLDVDAGHFTEANPAAQKLFKLTREELLQTGPIELSPQQQPDGRDSASAGLAFIQAALEGQRPVFEWTHRDRDNREIPCEVALLRLPDTTKRLVRGCITDISQRKQAEETRRRLEAQLRQAQKMEAIGTLAGGIAHDFNNILAGILGSIELAEHDLPAGDAARVQLDRARRASLRARDLVAKILTFSRRGEQQRAVHLLGPIVREAAGLLRASLPATIEIRTYISAEPAPVLCDIGQMHQVVMNLSANAAYAMQQRGGVLTISLETLVAEGAFLTAHPSFPPGRAACLSVADTGMGMDAATRDRIFEPFFTTKPIGEGTGLGLAVVHGIVQDHGGVITLESELKVGTKFRIFLPLSEAAPRGSASPFAPTHGAGQRVLVVDDETDVVAITTRALTNLGYRPTAFTRAADALAAFRATPQEFDAVVTDLMMPEIPGIDVVAAVRAVRPDLPVLVLSGYMRDTESQRMHELGITNFLEKPFPFASLATAMRDLFGRP